MKPTKKNSNLRLLLKRILKKRNMTYGSLAKKIGVSESTVKKWMTTRDIKIENLEKIGKAVDIDFLDIIKKDFTSINAESLYSVEQDKYFSEYPVDFLFFIKLRHNFTIDQIKKELNLSSSETYRIIKRLEKNDIGQLLSNDKFLMKLKGPLRLQMNGRMINTLFNLLRDELFKYFKTNCLPLSAAQDPESTLISRNFEFYLSHESAKSFAQELRELISKYSHISASEIELKQAMLPYGVMIALAQNDFWKQVIMKIPTKSLDLNSD